MFDAVAIFIVFITAILIAVADALMKMSAQSGKFLVSIQNPWMIVVCLLYFIQILMALYIFVHKGDLGIYGIIFVVFYSVLMVFLGAFYFGEHVSTVQFVGIMLALFGAALINSGW